jgi:hypothetical protein
MRYHRQRQTKDLIPCCIVKMVWPSLQRSSKNKPAVSAIRRQAKFSLENQLLGGLLWARSVHEPRRMGRGHTQPLPQVLRAWSHRSRRQKWGQMLPFGASKLAIDFGGQHLCRIHQWDLLLRHWVTPLLLQFDWPCLGSCSIEMALRLSAATSCMI